MKPGATAFARTPCTISSFDTARRRRRMPPLGGREWGWLVQPSSRRSRRRRSSLRCRGWPSNGPLARVPKNVPSRWTQTQPSPLLVGEPGQVPRAGVEILLARRSLGESCFSMRALTCRTCSCLAGTPALFTQTSTCRSRSSVSASARSTVVLSLTSALSAMPPTRPAVRSAMSPFTSRTARWPPQPPGGRRWPRSIPQPPPVTTATLPSSVTPLASMCARVAN